MSDHEGLMMLLCPAEVATQLAAGAKIPPLGPDGQLLAAASSASCSDQTSSAGLPAPLPALFEPALMPRAQALELAEVTSVAPGLLYMYTCFPRMSVKAFAEALARLPIVCPGG